MGLLYLPKYCDDQSILLVNQAGILKRLYCPFIVQCRNDVGIIKSGTRLWVDEVMTNKQDELIYLILGAPYLYSFFIIRASF